MALPDMKTRHRDFLTLFSEGDLIMLPTFQLDDYLEQLLDREGGNGNFMDYRAFVMLDEQAMNAETTQGGMQLIG